MKILKLTPGRLMKILKRIFWLFALFLWTLTIGITGMIIWLFLLMLSGDETSEKWFYALQKNGDVFVNRFHDACTQ
jgi:hypothetical protein